MSSREQTARRFQALGDEQRLTILDLLRERPRPVRELADALPVSRPAVSRHLRVLKEAGLVGDTAVGTQRIYQIHPQTIGELAAALDRFWDGVLGRFKLVADNIDPPAARG